MAKGGTTGTSVGANNLGEKRRNIKSRSTHHLVPEQVLLEAVPSGPQLQNAWEAANVMVVNVSLRTFMLVE